MEMTDELLAQVIEDACVEEYTEMMSDTRTHEFTKDFYAEMDLLINNAKKKTKIKHRKKITFLLVAAIIILNILTVVANEPLRIKFGKLIGTFYHNYIEFTQELFDEESMENSTFVVRKLVYTPMGYSLISENENIDTMSYNAIYTDKDNNILDYGQASIYNSVTNVTIDKEEAQKIKINGMDAYYYQDQEIRSISMEQEGYLYTLSGTCSKAELIKILESLDLQ